MLGGVGFALGTAVLAGAPSFAVFLAALALLDPASGAFVGLSQATLMDAAPGERERNLTRWTLAGWIGASAGPLLLAAGAPWRAAFAAYAALGAGLLVALRRRPIGGGDGGDGLRGLLDALRRPEVLRWLAVLELQDLSGDVLFGFLALYLVDGAGASPRAAAAAVVVWTAAGLTGNLILPRVLSRVESLRWLRASAAGVALLVPVFLLAPGLAAKLAAAAATGALGAGWYPISQARLYQALPGRSGTAAAAATAAGAAGIAWPLLLALLAALAGLPNALWLVLAAPLALLVGVPRS